MSVVSPLTASWLVVTTILGAIFFDERVGWVKGFLISVVLLGIVFTSSRGRDSGSISGFWHGIAGMMIFGVAFALWKPMVSAVAPSSP